jgi:hypothetical protein
MLTYHSSSLLLGATPYVRSEQDRDEFLAILAGYIEFFLTECAGRSEALSAIKAHLVAERPRPERYRPQEAAVKVSGS